ncbi:endonuclease domain-containing protein [Bibersteinia trehalosi]|uniref:Endonuclease domain-containing protein n=1 Tax=Bibersteinia trehalosi TaxID=47735 RepID=A0A3R8MYW9_BIBTR|nr:endonuclease domain-containing protein [Bibersteinia trehalosi]RRN00428.1 endonuclease domain-containing protein [Bibersteinia trehalosi]
MRKTETLNLRRNAKILRSNMTEAERVLWYYLRAKRFCGIKFYRQKIVGNYIADFLSLNPRLIIELDGSQHAEQIEYDRIRTTYLEEQQFTVIRFWNDEVLRNINMVLDVIFAAIHENIPSPSENLRFSPPSPVSVRGEYITGKQYETLSNYSRPRSHRWASSSSASGRLCETDDLYR